MQSDNSLKRKGMAGGLALFCFIVIVLQPLLTVLSFFSGLESQLAVYLSNPSTGLLMGLQNVVTLAVLVAGIILGVLILRGNEDGKNYALKYLQWRVSANLLSALATYVYLSSSVISQAILLENTLRHLVIPEVLFFVIWWAYFKKSKKMRETYG